MDDIEITVTDINDNSPVFDQPNQSQSIDEENSVPTTLFLSPARDDDSEEYSVNRYQLLDQTSDTFSLEAGTWSAGSLPLSLIINRVISYL